MKIYLKGERGPGEKRGGSRENNRTRGGWGGRERSGLDGGTGRVLWEDGSREGERPADGVQERGKTEGMREQEMFRLRSGLERVGRKGGEHGRGNWFQRNSRRTPEG